MARNPIDGARFVRILGKDVVQRNVRLVTTDDMGNGMIVNNGKRAMPADSIANLIDAFLASNPAHTLGAIGHGVRLVCDPVSGNGSPCFVESKGASTGTLYLFGGADKREAILAAFEAAGVAIVKADVEGAAKKGLRVTLAPDADGSAVLGVLMAHTYNTGGPNDWDGGPLAQQMCEALGVPFAPKAAKQPKATEVKADAPKATKGKRKDKAGKGEGELAHIRAESA